MHLTHAMEELKMLINGATIASCGVERYLEIADGTGAAHSLSASVTD